MVLKIVVVLVGVILLVWARSVGAAIIRVRMSQLSGSSWLSADRVNGRRDALNSPGSRELETAFVRLLGALLIVGAIGALIR
jgi:hypothetical protein